MSAASTSTVGLGSRAGEEPVAGRKIPELDGVRAISVAFVLLLHVSYGRLSGGFLGVDIFFVLSGYLITRLLLAEFARTGTLSLGYFYARRALRILPALLITLLLALGLAATVGPVRSNPLQVTAAVALFYANFIPAENMGNLGHTWSLAIEEQFYLVWPAVLLFALRRQSRLAVNIAAAVVIAVLLARQWMVMTISDRDLIYTFTLARADSLMIGCLASLLEAGCSVRLRATLKRLAGGLAWIAAGLLVGALFFASREFMQGFAPAFTLFALVAAVFLLACQHAGPANTLRAFLGSRPLQWLGQRSYGLYLYHYPIFAAAEGLRVAGDFGNYAWVSAAKVLLALAFTELAWRWIERPILTNKRRFNVT